MVFAGHSRVSGIGSFIPKEAISSVQIFEELKAESRFGIPKTWMDENLEILSRRYCDDGDKPSDIATLASYRALSDAGIDTTDLDGIIYCGITGDLVEPGTAHILQNNLGATRAICKDVTNACHGFCDGMFFADLMIGAGAEHILVATAELTRASRLAMPFLMSTKSKTGFLSKIGALSLGDAAGAVVLSAKSDTEIGIKSISSKSFGGSAKLCTYGLDEGSLLGMMDMLDICQMVFRQSLMQVPSSLSYAGWNKNQVTSLVMHQVGGGPHRKVIEVAGFSNADVPKTFDRLGNITTATIPINLELVKKLTPGIRHKMCILGGGSGITSSVILTDS